VIVRLRDQRSTKAGVILGRTEIVGRSLVEGFVWAARIWAGWVGFCRASGVLAHDNDPLCCASNTKTHDKYFCIIKIFVITFDIL
jgi:hypothetical protein